MKSSKNSKKSYAIIALIVLLLALAIGYAAFSSTLTINGTAKGTGTWNVHFQEPKLLNANGETDSSHGTATLAQTTVENDTINAEITLAYPGDGVILEATVINDGNVPAKLSEFSITGLESDQDIEVTQAVSGPVVDEELAAGGTCTARFVIKWKEDSTATEVKDKKFTITYEYTQNTTPFNGQANHVDA